MIPGLFGSAFGFRSLAPQLAQAGHRTIVIEPLGIGWSSRPEKADYSLTAQADRMAAVLDSLGERGAIVIAHSVGGSIALRLAYRRSDLVAGLVSLEGGPAETVASPGFRTIMRFAPLMGMLGGVHTLRTQVYRILVAASEDAGWITDSVVYGYTAGAASDLGGTLSAFRAMSNARETDQLAGRLREIRGPVRLVVGATKHGGEVSSADVKTLRDALRSFAVDSVAGVGHFVHEERPAAVMASVERLKATLAEQGGREEPY